jgi:hypothetical protein
MQVILRSVDTASADNMSPHGILIQMGKLAHHFLDSESAVAPPAGNLVGGLQDFFVYMHVELPEYLCVDIA